VGGQQICLIIWVADLQNENLQQKMDTTAKLTAGEL
jgi:hypothetical protein